MSDCATDPFEVIILGSGLGGTMLAAVLARQGRRVLVLEAGQHPRFAIGESTTPSATVLFKILGERFDVPEITALGDFHSGVASFGTAHGLKQGFSFLFHEDGCLQDPAQSQQLPTIAALGSDIHLYRQDCDAAMLAAATRYGATVKQGVGPYEVEIHAEGVRVVTASGATYRGAFIVDGTGSRSRLAELLDLREQPCGFATQSRSIFGHVVGLTPYDALSAHTRHGFSYPVHQTTLHHLFDGGWFWVIPFDNHPTSSNPVCSVGLTLDCRFHPPGQSEPAFEEFARFVQRFPSIAAHFSASKAVREWVSTPPLQYSSRKVCGARWALLPHSAAFVDPLFSAGLAQTAAAVYDLGLALDGSGNVVRDDYGAALQASLSTVDRLVSTSYEALHRGHEVWNAWYRVWVMGSLIGPYVQLVGLSRYYASGDKAELDRVRGPELRSLLGFGIPALARVLDDCECLVKDGRLGNDEVARRIERRVNEVDFLGKRTGFSDISRRGLAPFTLAHSLHFAIQQPRLLKPHLPTLGDASALGIFRHEIRKTGTRVGRAMVDALRPLRRLVATG